VCYMYYQYLHEIIFVELRTVVSTLPPQ
jgi:hypothetical protein